MVVAMVEKKRQLVNLVTGLVLCHVMSASCKKEKNITVLGVVLKKFSISKIHTRILEPIPMPFDADEEKDRHLYRSLSSEEVRKYVRRNLSCRMEQILSKHFKPTRLEVIKKPFNETATIKGDKAPYRIDIVSPMFTNITIPESRKLVEDLLLKKGFYKRADSIKIHPDRPRRKYVKKNLTYRMQLLLTKHFKPIHLEILKKPFNATAAIEGDKAPYRVIIVAPIFENITLPECHKLVQELLRSKGFYKKAEYIQVRPKKPKVWEYENFEDELEEAIYL